MKAKTIVKIVDHDGYVGIHNVGGVGEVSRLEEKRVWVKFEGQEEDVEYPVELVQELTEEEQAQLKGEGKDGTPDTSKPTPPDTTGGAMDDLEGEQKQVAQASGGGERPGGSAPETTSAPVVLKGEQPDVEQPAGGPERPTGSGQTAGVSGQQLVMKGQQPQLTGVGSKTEGVRRRRRVKEQGEGGLRVGPFDDSEEAREVGRRLRELDGVLDVAPVRLSLDVSFDPSVITGEEIQDEAEGSEALESTKRRERVKEGAFRPITVNVLEQGDKDDEYVTLGEGSSIRSEHHLMASIRSAVRKAMEGMEKPFDIVDVVFRRAPVQEEKRRKAERALMATLHLLDEGKAKSGDVRRAAQAAAKVGVRTDRLAEYTGDRYAKKILEDAVKEQSVGGSPKIIWPPKELAKHVGAHVIVETRTGDRLVGTLAKGPGPRLFNVKTQSGTHKFSVNDVSRILIKSGAK